MVNVIACERVVGVVATAFPDRSLRSANAYVLLSDAIQSSEVSALSAHAYNKTAAVKVEIGREEVEKPSACSRFPCMYVCMYMYDENEIRQQETERIPKVSRGIYSDRDSARQGTNVTSTASFCSL